MEDSSDITRLVGQLGYQASEDEIRKRLGRLNSSTSDLVLVAEREDGIIVGWIHGSLSQLLESPQRVEIGGLVVDQNCRRKGIGAKLVGGIEEWALKNSVTQASVRCRTTRVEAHRFYEGLGFQAAKTQIAFRKPLVVNPSP